MREIIGGFCSLALITALATLADAQQSKTGYTKNNSTVATGAAAQHDAPLVFTETIPQAAGTIVSVAISCSVLCVNCLHGILRFA